MRPQARRLAAVALAVGLVATGAAACSDDSSSESFCERLPDMPDVAAILADLDSSDPGGVETAVEAGIAEFRALEADAPGAVRADIARLRRGVELVLEAVRDNPGDLPAARDAILDRTDELSGLVQAGQRVSDYARTECGITLQSSLDSEVSTPSSTPTTVAGDDEPTETSEGG